MTAILNNVKRSCNELALLGGKPVFDHIRSTSNLVTPDIETFLSYAKESFDSHWLTNNGPIVKRLEQRLAELHQVEHCVTFCNGLWGLVTCIKQLALPGKTEVVMPSMTYRRLADITAWVNLTPHFCDVDPDVLGPSVATVEPCINDNTALLLIAQPIVNICDMEGLVNLAEKHEIPIVFDSVEAAYASFNGKMIGGFGQAECFSMHASKLLNGFEGGYMTTNDSELAENLKKIRAFGFSGPDNVEILGLNAKLNEFHAAMTLASVDELEDQVNRNRKRYHIYCKLLENIAGLEIVNYDENEIRGFKNILVLLNHQWPITRSETLDILHAENMLARPYYSPPLHKKKSTYATISKELPVSDQLTEKYVLLPSGEFLSNADIAEVVGLLEFIQENGREISLLLKKRK